MAPNLQSLPFLLLTLISFLFSTFYNPCLALSEDKKVYIVYMGGLSGQQLSESSIRSNHLSMLQNVLQGSSAEERLVRSYKRSFSGFAASLTEEEQQKIAGMDGVVSVFKSEILKLKTTRSWDFVGFKEPVKRNLVKESDVIVGMIDSGVWPESESFSDEGFGPPPKKWKGTCQTEGNFTCNNKLIGARYYNENASSAVYGARDISGHGTHTASTVAGRKVKGVSFYGLAPGYARGAVPSARIVVYNVCDELGCPDSSILAAFDDAIADGVDIISVSIGPELPRNYSSDSLAIGSFHAILKGVLTSQAAGNEGPAPGSVVSGAPWIFTVAASSIDRKILTKANVGNGSTYLGRALNTFNSTKYYPLIHAANASTTCKSEDASKPQAKILESESTLDSEAPVVVSFSSRGPNPISFNIAKPDIAAPGVEILAAFSPVASLTDLPEDKRSVKYSILSGTSMACPHVSGASAYVKSFHPEWSPAAIKSALMTTAFPMDPRKNPEAEFAYGAGQINPLKAVHPGLVYDADKGEYLQFLCSEGYSAKEIWLISGEDVECKAANGTHVDVNYPSIQARVGRNKTFSFKYLRTVTNVGLPGSTYKAIVRQHPAFHVAVQPSVLSFKSLNEKLSFVVIVTGKGSAKRSAVSTPLVWSDGVHNVRSPIMVYTSLYL